MKLLIILILFSNSAIAERFNPWNCQTDKTELKRIEINLTKRIFLVWDQEGKINKNNIENVWLKANEAARRIVVDNYTCNKS